MSNDLLYQIALTLVANIGPVQAKILTEHFGNTEAIFKASKKELGNIEGIGEVRAKYIKMFDNFSTAEKEIEFVEKYKIQTVFVKDENYP